jgi:hypothetical protein
MLWQLEQGCALLTDCHHLDTPYTGPKEHKNAECLYLRLSLVASPRAVRHWMAAIGIPEESICQLPVEATKGDEVAERDD